MCTQIARKPFFSHAATLFRIDSSTPRVLSAASKRRIIAKMDVGPARSIMDGGADKPKQRSSKGSVMTYRPPSSTVITGQTLLLYDPRMEDHCFEGADRDGIVGKNNRHHPENPNRITYPHYKIMQDLQLVQTIRCDYGRDATDEELLLYHTRQHIDLIHSSQSLDVDACSALAQPFDSVYFNSHTWSAAVRAAGCALHLVDQICTGEVPNGFALVRPPGHHATAEASMGYSIFNNAALAAKHALKQHNLHRILLLDWDVHHGNGTQHAFYDDPRVLYISIHRFQQGRYWPHLTESDFTHTGCGHGAGFNINVPLNETGCNFADYFHVFHHLLLPIICEFAPELIIVSAGFDSARGDPKGEMSLEPEAFAHFTHWLKMFAGGRVAMLLEGGYNLAVLADCVTQCLHVLSATTLRHTVPRLSFHSPLMMGKVDKPWSGPKQSVRQTVDLLILALRQYWSCLQPKQLLPSPSAFKKSSVSDSPPVESPATAAAGDDDDVQFLYSSDQPPVVTQTLSRSTAATKLDGRWTSADCQAVSDAVAEMNGENVENTRMQLSELHITSSEVEGADAPLNVSNEMHHDAVDVRIFSAFSPDKANEDECTVLRATPEHSFVNNNDYDDDSVVDVDTSLANRRQQHSPASRDTVIAYDDRMLLHDNSYQDTEPHVERKQRLTSIYGALERYGLLKRCRELTKPIVPVEDDAILACHSSRLLQEVDSFRKLPTEVLEDYNVESGRASIFANPDTSLAARVAAGGVVQCVDEVMSDRARNGFAIVRPPGHHAEHDRCFGFCFFNNVVVAARHAQRAWGVQRVLIVDWDVHHGNGVQNAFYNDPSVLYISLHQLNIFPGQKHQPILTGSGDGVGFNVNIGWNPSATRSSSRRAGGAGEIEVRGDAAYMNAFLRCIMPMAYEFDPDLVLVSAGFDSAKDDLLGDCNVTPVGFGLMTHMLMGVAGGRVILALEGGYNLRVIGECAAACTAALLGDQIASIDVHRQRVAESQASDDLWQTLSYVCASNKWKMLMPPRGGASAGKTKNSEERQIFF